MFHNCLVIELQGNFISCVPQGSVLGPVLFLNIFVNGVISTCSGNTTVTLFADDLKRYRVFNIGDNSSYLQQSIDKLVNWSKLWQIQINSNKCHVFPIRTKSNLNTSSRYTLSDYPLSTLTLTSDLGVFVDSDLTFNEHIYALLLLSATTRERLFSRVCFDIVGHVRKAFTTEICPIEYNSNALNPSGPSHKYLVGQLEYAQCRFTK